MLRKMLFETRIGEWLLSLLEHKVGLVIVEANVLADLPAVINRPSSTAQ